jgi:hypothetical protein
MNIEMVEPEPTPTPEAEPAPAEAPAVTSIEEVRAARHTKCFVAETRALKNGDVESYISAESPDRLGDMIRAKGWEFGNYRKTGSPVLFGHENGITPGGHIAHIGNAVDIAVQGKRVWSVTRFHEKTQLSREAAILAREKIVPNWSVGFNPLEPPEHRMEDGVFKGYIFNRQELLEYSLVLIPAHPDAVSKDASQEALAKALFYVDKGLIRREVAAVIAGPAPLAGTDSGNDDGRLVMPAESRLSDEHLAKMAGLHFLKRLA